MTTFIESFDATIEDGLMWLTDHAGDFFSTISQGLQAFYKVLDHALQAGPWWLVALLIGLAGWRLVGRSFGVIALSGLWLCQAMGLWAETMSTLTLVFVSTLMALLIAVPLGVWVGLSARRKHGTELVLDFVQTMPPYIFLLP